jgi:hypothetical protein
MEEKFQRDDAQHTQTHTHTYYSTPSQPERSLITTEVEEKEEKTVSGVCVLGRHQIPPQPQQQQHFIFLFSSSH